jgi:hypothetical protein
VRQREKGEIQIDIKEGELKRGCTGGERYYGET